jgi:hypothetical protein
MRARHKLVISIEFPFLFSSSGFLVDFGFSFVVLTLSHELYTVVTLEQESGRSK